MNTFTLDEVNKSIKICENIAKSDPGYYDAHWVDKHQTLLTVKEELEEKEEQK